MLFRRIGTNFHNLDICETTVLNTVVGLASKPQLIGYIEAFIA